MTFLSVGPSLDFSSGVRGVGAGVGADVVGAVADAGTVVGVAGVVADVAVIADAGVATATAAPAASFKFGASHAFQRKEDLCSRLVGSPMLAPVRRS